MKRMFSLVWVKILVSTTVGFFFCGPHSSLGKVQYLHCGNKPLLHKTGFCPAVSIITTWLSESCPTNRGGFSLGVLWPRDAFQKVTQLCFSNSFSSYSFLLNKSRFPDQWGFLPSSPSQDYEAGVSHCKVVDQIAMCSQASMVLVINSLVVLNSDFKTNSLFNVEYLWLAPFS